jgi:hypothetical protein
VLTVIAVVGLGMAGYRWTRGLVESLEDPDARDAKVREILGAEKLPEGYYAAMGMEVPWVTEIAIISDRPVHFERQDPHSLDIDLKDESFGDEVFMYLGTRAFSNKEKDIERFFAGRQMQSMQNNTGGSRVRDTELLREGEIEVRGTPVRYRIDRGRIDLESGETEGRGVRLRFRCADSGWVHLGIWSGPAAPFYRGLHETTPGRPPEAGLEAVAPEAREATREPGPVTGVPADEASLREFLGHFDICG